MYNKSYENFLKPLREREARPPFDRMAEVIANAPARRAVVPTFVRLFIGIVLCAAIGVGSFMLLEKYHSNAPAIQSQRNEMSVAGDVSHRKAGSEKPLESRMDGMLESPAYRPSGTFHAKQHLFPVTRVTGYQHHVPSGRSSVIDTPASIFDGASLHPSRTVGIQLIAFNSEAGNSLLPPPIAMEDSEQPNPRNFFVAIGGAVAQQFSSDAAFRQFTVSDASVGIGYNLSRSSSIRVLGGEEVFALSQNSYYTTYHDTSFIHDGISYANIIGEVHTVSSASLTRVYWLGASYRYTLGYTFMRPFAEIMAGGSTNGLLAHQSIGAEFTLSQHIDFDVLAQMSELLPQGSAWLTKAGASLEVSYAP